MNKENILDISIEKLKSIPTPGGNIMHALKSSEDNFNGFGEAYFSWIEYNYIKAWKKHTKMIMNLIVPVGMIQLVFYEEHTHKFRSENIGFDRYMRLTVPPGIWFGFKGLHKKENLLLNIASIPHDPKEVEHCDISAIQYNW